MRKMHYVWLLALLCSCRQEASHTNSVTAQAAEEAKFKASTHQKKIKKEPIIHTVQRTHPFSSSGQPDYFRLTLRGDSVTSGQVEFTITTSSGQRIYQHIFPASDLEASLVNEMQKPTASSQDRQAFILRRMDEFVQSQDFLQPAIAPASPVTTTFVSEAVWKRIQTNPKAIGFRYLLGKEDGHLIVYDPEQKKAIRYSSIGG